MISPRSVPAITCLVFGARNLAEERARLIGIIGLRLTVVRGHALKAAPW
jgi:hypothetical protein